MRNVTATATALVLAFPVMGSAMTVNIAEKGRADNDVSVPQGATEISEANYGIDPNPLGDSNFASGSFVTPAADFTFFGTMGGGKDAFRFEFTSDFTASLDTFEFQPATSGPSIDFEFDRVGNSVSDLTTVTSNGDAQSFGTFGAGTYDFFVDGSDGSGDAVDYDVTFAAVPLPAAGWALITALGALGVAGRRRRRAA